MNFNKAVKILRERSRFKVISVDKENGTISTEGPFGDKEEMNTKDVISLARCFTSDYTPKYKGFVKALSNRKNRTKTRELLNKGDFDSIPQQGVVDSEDVWNWD